MCPPMLGGLTSMTLTSRFSVAETWKPVPSLPGIMASSEGRYLLPPRHTAMPHGGVRLHLPKPTLGSKRKACATAKHAYRGFYHAGRNFKVHQLVCEAFHGPKPFARAVVIHLDENALNNRPENLKWGTQKENLNAPGFKEYCQGRTGDNSPRAKWLAKREAA